MKVWTKTLLSSYRYLDRVANAIDKIVRTRAINSFYVSGNNMSFNSVDTVSSDILNLTERKVNLINLKIILDEALRKINSKQAMLLTSVFIECQNCYQSSESLEISLRTFFRRQNQALESFEKVLYQLGYSAEQFEKILSKENWIMEIRFRYLSSKKHLEDGKENVERKIVAPSKEFKKTNNKTSFLVQKDLQL